MTIPCFLPQTAAAVLFLATQATAFLPPSTPLCLCRQSGLRTTLSATNGLDHALKKPKEANGITPLIVKPDDANSKEMPKEFEWFKSWYPLVPVDYLNREKPTVSHTSLTSEISVY